MSKVNRILVPVDFSDAARDAAQYAEALAQRFSAEVVLLHALPPFHLGFSMVDIPATRHEYVEARNRSVLTALESFPGSPWDGVAVRRDLREGDAAEEIISHAQDKKVDAIVMPTRGGNALQRLLLMGSVTAKVLSAVGCPVLTGVHLKRPTGGLQFRCILCAVDLGGVTTRVLSWGSQLAKLFGARLVVVHAAPHAGDSAVDYFDETWRVTLHSRLREHMNNVIGDLGMRAEIEVNAGPAPRIVTSAAQKAAADLVIIGRSTSDDFLGRLRANAYEIIRQSRCPVVSV